MKKTVLLCVLSAAAGGCWATWSGGPVGSSPAAAEERGAEIVPADPFGVGPRVPVAARSVAAPPLDESLTPEERVNVAVYESVNRGVVNINTKSVAQEKFLLFEVIAEGSGSGMVLDTRGHILTNFHVVDGAREIQVVLFDGKSYDARLVGKDESNDVAVIKIDAPASSLMPVSFGDSTRLKVGQRVYAIGNPFGLERTLTTGIISSLNRSLPARNHRTIKSVIQIDAAINPGNSGGPLLDTHARLIGMNTAIASATGQSSGVGFAIPVANIARVVPQLIDRGRVIRPDSGIVKVLQTEQGLLIATMTPGGPAEQAGLRGFRIVKQRRGQGPFSYQSTTIDRTAADLIVAVDGEKVTDAGDFLAFVEAKRPGEQVIITVIREGRELKVPVRLVAGES